MCVRVCVYVCRTTGVLGIPIIQLTCMCICVCVYVYVCHKTGASEISIIQLICACVYVYVCIYMCLFVLHDESFWDTHYPIDFGIPIIQLCMCVYGYLFYKT